MIIKDSKGMYELKLDTGSSIVYEKLVGLFSEDDMERLHNEYSTKIASKVKGTKWTKCSDLREYRLSNIKSNGAKHMEWCQKNGMVPGVILIDRSVVKMQMNKLSKTDSLSPVAFTELSDAIKWLKEKGFNI